MKIYNKTNQVQELQVYDRNTNLPYSIYVGAKSSTSIDLHLATPSLSKLVNAGIFQILDSVPAPAVLTESHEEVTPETKEDETHEDHKEGVTPETEEDETPDEIPDETPVVDEETKDIPDEKKDEEVTKFICDVCHGEFASQRSLTMHKNKAHS